MGGPPLDNSALTDLIRELVVQQRQLRDSVEVIRQSTLPLLPPESYLKTTNTTGTTGPSSNAPPPTKPFISLDEIVTDIRELKQSVSTLTRDMSLFRQEQQHHNAEVQKQVLYLDSEVSRMQNELSIVSTNVSTCDSSMKTLSDHVYNDMQKVSLMVKAVRTGNEQQMNACMAAIERQGKKTLELEEAIISTATNLSNKHHETATALAHSALNAFDTIAKGASITSPGLSRKNCTGIIHCDGRGDEAFELGLRRDFDKMSSALKSEPDSYGHISSTEVVEDRYLPSDSDDDADDSHSRPRRHSRKHSRRQKKQNEKNDTNTVTPSPSPFTTNTSPQPPAQSPKHLFIRSTSSPNDATARPNNSDPDAQRPWSPSSPRSGISSPPISPSNQHTMSVPGRSPHSLAEQSITRSPRHGTAFTFTNAGADADQEASHGKKGEKLMLETKDASNDPLKFSARVKETKDALKGMNNGSRTGNHGKSRKSENSEKSEFVDSTKFGESRLLQTLGNVLQTSVPKIENPLTKIPTLRLPRDSEHDENLENAEKSYRSAKKTLTFDNRDSAPGNPANSRSGGSDNIPNTSPLDLTAIQTSLRSLTEALFASLHHDLRMLHHTVSRLDARQVRDSDSLVSSTQEALSVLKNRMDQIEYQMGVNEDEKKNDIRVWSTRVMGLERDLATDIQRLEAKIGKSGRENRVIEEGLKKTIDELQSRVSDLEKQITISCGNAKTLTQTIHIQGKTSHRTGVPSRPQSALSSSFAASTPLPSVSQPSVAAQDPNTLATNPASQAGPSFTSTNTNLNASTSNITSNGNSTSNPFANINTIPSPNANAAVVTLSHTPIESQIATISHELALCRMRIDTFSGEMVRRLHTLESEVRDKAKDGERQMERLSDMLNDRMRAYVREAKDDMGKIMSAHTCPCLLKAGVGHMYGDVVVKSSPGPSPTGRPGSAGKLMLGKLGGKNIPGGGSSSGFSGYAKIPDTGNPAFRQNSLRIPTQVGSSVDGGAINSPLDVNSDGSNYNKSPTPLNSLPITDGGKTGPLGTSFTSAPLTYDTLAQIVGRLNMNGDSSGNITGDNASNVGNLNRIPTQTIDGRQIPLARSITGRSRVSPSPLTSSASMTTSFSTPTANNGGGANVATTAAATINRHTTKSLSQVLGATNNLSIGGNDLGKTQEHSNSGSAAGLDDGISMETMGIPGYAASVATPQHLGLSRARRVTQSQKK